MKKLIKVCNMVAFIFLLSFFLKLGRDWMLYDSTFNSAPFSVWIIADAIRYLLPAGFTFLIGRFLKATQDNKEKNDSDASPLKYKEYTNGRRNPHI